MSRIVLRLGPSHRDCFITLISRPRGRRGMIHPARHSTWGTVHGDA